MSTNHQHALTLGLQRIAVGVALTATLAGCGYKGPLFMPPPPPPDAALTTPPPPAQALTDDAPQNALPTTTATPVE